MEVLKELTEVGEKLGYSEESLRQFVSDQQSAMRNQRVEERDKQKADREANERESEREHSHKMELLEAQ
jgi:hypothetical protein